MANGGTRDFGGEDVWLDLACPDDRMCYMMARSLTVPGPDTRTVRLMTASDLHQRAILYTELEGAVRTHRPDAVVLVGDFLHGMEPEREMLSVQECAHAISRLQVPEVLAVRGNHEHVQFAEFMDAMPSASVLFTTLHGEAARVGCMTLLGFECLLGNDVTFTMLKEPLPPVPGAWVPKLMCKLGSAGRCLWVAHEPPIGTPLSATTGPLAGNHEWTALIERFKPRMMICGHDHGSPINRNRWHHRMDDTVIVNVGQSDYGPLHYCMIEAEFEPENSPLPKRMVVQAFPWEEDLVLGAD